MTVRVAPRGAGALLVVLLAGACFAERHRYDAPRLKLRLDRTVLRPGEDVTGTATAIDGSGVTILGVRVMTPDGSAQYRLLDFVRRDSVEFVFRGALAGTVAGDTVVVQAFAQDTDLFHVTIEDTAVVRQAP